MKYTFGRKRRSMRDAMNERWTTARLLEATDRYESELRDAGLSPLTVWTYSDQSKRFVRWLQGEYRPRGPNGSDAPTG